MVISELFKPLEKQFLVRNCAPEVTETRLNVRNYIILNSRNENQSEKQISFMFLHASCYDFKVGTVLTRPI